MSDGATLSERVRLELASLPGPGGAGKLGDAALQSVEAEGTEVIVVLRLDGSAAERVAVEEAVRNAALAVEGVSDCVVDVTSAQPPARRSAASKGGKAQAAQGPQRLAGAARVLAVASGKGGVGKSTVALNLALALRRQGLKVGLLDADVHGPSLPILLGLSSVQPTARNGRLEPIELHGLSVMSLGFLLDTSQPVIWRGPMIAGAIKQLLQDVDWQDLDVLVVDLPPGTGDAQLTLVQTVQVDQALIVTTPSDLALSDARRGLQMFRAVKVPVMGIVENMSYFLCPHCDERADIFGSGGGARVAEALEVALLGEIPIDIGVSRANDEGKPLMRSAPDSPAGKVFQALADKAGERLGVQARVEADDTKGEQPGLLASLFTKKD